MVVLVIVMTGVFMTILHFMRQPLQSIYSPKNDSASGVGATQDRLGKTAINGKAKTEDEMLDRHNLGASAFDTRIRLWGKVVDQHGNPVEGAMIKAIATTLRMVKVENGYREYEILSAQSAADGTFMFDGAEGFSLTIRQLSKDGYVLPSAYQAGIRWEGARYRFRYKSIGDVQSVFHPNPEQPVVFHLWKLNKPEPIKVRDIGRSGPIVKVGSAPTKLFSISILVTSIGTANAPEWQVTLTSRKTGGGLIAAAPSDVFMFDAPSNGYTSSIKFRYSPKGASEMGDAIGIPVRYYEVGEGGSCYSANELVFYEPRDDGIVLYKMRSWTNPNGSRNLEHDAAHLLESPRLTR